MSIKPSEALELHREEIREIIGKYHVTNPRVFGSVLHGQDTEKSDLDILVDSIKGKTTLFDMTGIQVKLEALLHVPVDVRTPGDLSEKFRNDVLEEAKPL